MAPCCLFFFRKMHTFFLSSFGCCGRNGAHCAHDIREMAAAPDTTKRPAENNKSRNVYKREREKIGCTK
jgi:hypothetical protein